jgi:hypothetical protein
LVSCIFHLSSFLGESPFVSKLQKAESAQQTVRPAGRTLRIFKQFVWLEADSVKMTLSRPAHLPVTQTVGQLMKVSGLLRGEEGLLLTPFIICLEPSAVCLAYSRYHANLF